MAVAAEAEAHGDFARQRAHGATRNAEEAHLLDVSGVPKAVLLFGELLGSAAAAEDHADLALFVHGHCFGIEAGVANGFVRSGDGQGNDAGNVLALTRIDPGEFIEFGDFSGNVNWKSGSIEAGDPLDARLAGENGPAEGFFTDAVRTDDADSGDRDTWQHRSFDAGLLLPQFIHANEPASLSQSNFSVRCVNPRQGYRQWDNRT